MNQLEWEKFKIVAARNVKVLENYIEHLNWTIIGALVFLLLLSYYIYDSMAGSQVSGWFVVIVIILLLALGFASTFIVSSF